eukprot:jgi/Hompol1/2932/HPOL_001495-RA
MTEEERIALKGNKVADVILFSGCRDDQTSSDAKVNGRATGAMSYALLKSLREHGTLTYAELMFSIRTILAEHFSQVPQISTARHMDMDHIFEI